MIDFLEGVETARAPGLNTITEGLELQRVIDAIYRSSDEERAIQL